MNSDALILKGLRNQKHRLEKSKKVEEYLQVTAAIDALTKVSGTSKGKPLTPLEVFNKKYASKKSKIKAKRRVKFKKDMDNSPVSHIPFGERTRQIHKWAVEALFSLGKKSTIEEVEAFISRVHDVKWMTGKRLASYISRFNTLYPREAVIEMHKNGVSRTGMLKYTDINFAA